MDFWLQVISTLIGTLAGALSALGTGYLVRRRESREKEVAALNGLLLDLQFKRALTLVEPQAAEMQSLDAKRCTESVLHSRQLIREARLQLRPNSRAFGNLARMFAACNTYLQATRANPENYQYELMKLRGVLDDEAKDLAADKGVSYRSPGSFAYSSLAS